MAGYCTLVLYFHSPAARENTAAYSCNIQPYYLLTHQIIYISPIQFTPQHCTVCPVCKSGHPSEKSKLSSFTYTGRGLGMRLRGLGMRLRPGNEAERPGNEAGSLRMRLRGLGMRLRDLGMRLKAWE